MHCFAYNVICAKFVTLISVCIACRLQLEKKGNIIALDRILLTNELVYHPMFYYICIFI